MANVHVQTAATNLRQGINDARIRQKQLHDEISRLEREAEAEIRQRERERLMLRSQGNDNEKDGGSRLQAGVRFDQIDVEEKQIRQGLEARRRELEAEIQQLEDQALQLDSVARQLDGMV